MFQHSHLIIQSTFTQSRSVKIGAIALVFILMLLPIANSASVKLSNFELSGVVLNDSDSLAVLFDKDKRKELILKVGDVVGGCVLDYVRRSRVSFYCNDQVLTLTLRSLSIDITSSVGKDVGSPPVNITQKEQQELFDQPANFITTFNLVPHMQDGQLAAFEVQNLPEDDAANRLDLQKGDLIVAINGVLASNHDVFSNAFEQIKFTQTVELELIRDEVRHYKSYLLQR